MDSRNNDKRITANSLKELDKKTQDIIAQGWLADGPPVENEDGTFTQKVIQKKNDS